MADKPALRGLGLRAGGVATTLTSLNEDVLLHIFRMLTRRSLLNFMSTCRYIFHTGLPALLARPYYGIDCGRLQSFYGFLSSFAPASFLALRHLEFSDYDTADELNIVAETLKRATNLRDLSIGPETFHCEAIVTAVSSLPKLRNLHILNENPNSSYSILEHLRAPLTHLRLEVDDSTRCRRDAGGGACSPTCICEYFTVFYHSASAPRHTYEPPYQLHPSFQLRSPSILYQPRYSSCTSMIHGYIQRIHYSIHW